MSGDGGGLYVPESYGGGEVEEEEVRHIEASDLGGGGEQAGELPDDSEIGHGYDLSGSGEAVLDDAPPDVITQTPPNCKYAFVVIVGYDGVPSGFNLVDLDTGTIEGVEWPVPEVPSAQIQHMRRALLEVADDIRSMHLVHNIVNNTAHATVQGLMQMGAQMQQQAADQALVSKVMGDGPPNRAQRRHPGR